MVRDPEFLVNCPDASKKSFVASSELGSTRTSRLKTELLNMFPVGKTSVYWVTVYCREVSVYIQLQRSQNCKKNNLSKFKCKIVKLTIIQKDILDAIMGCSVF